MDRAMEGVSAKRRKVMTEDEESSPQIPTGSHLTVSSFSNPITGGGLIWKDGGQITFSETPVQFLQTTSYNGQDVCVAERKKSPERRQPEVQIETGQMPQMKALFADREINVHKEYMNRRPKIKPSDAKDLYNGGITSCASTQQPEFVAEFSKCFYTPGNQRSHGSGSTSETTISGSSITHTGPSTSDQYGQRDESKMSRAGGNYETGSTVKQTAVGQAQSQNITYLMGYVSRDYKGRLEHPQLGEDGRSQLQYNKALGSFDKIQLPEGLGEKEKIIANSLFKTDSVSTTDAAIALNKADLASAKPLQAVLNEFDFKIQQHPPAEEGKDVSTATVPQIPKPSTRGSVLVQSDSRADEMLQVQHNAVQSNQITTPLGPTIIGVQSATTSSCPSMNIVQSVATPSVPSMNGVQSTTTPLGPTVNGEQFPITSHGPRMNDVESATSSYPTMNDVYFVTTLSVPPTRVENIARTPSTNSMASFSFDPVMEQLMLGQEQQLRGQRFGMDPAMAGAAAHNSTNSSNKCKDSFANDSAASIQIASNNHTDDFADQGGSQQRGASLDVSGLPLNCTDPNHTPVYTDTQIISDLADWLVEYRDVL